MTWAPLITIYIREIGKHISLYSSTYATCIGAFRAKKNSLVYEGEITSRERNI